MIFRLRAGWAGLLFLTAACGDDDAGSVSETSSGGETTAEMTTAEPTTTPVPTTGTGGEMVCVPGAASVCDCPGGGEGQQTCVADGSGLGPCDCPAAVCGNGSLDDGEVCDDGTNDGSYDGCLPDCSGLGPHCGDGSVQGPEACDDGNDVDGDGCNNNCVISGSELWSRGYAGEDAGNARARGVAVDGWGNVIIVGQEFVVGQNANVWVRKYTPDGDVLWTWTYNGPNIGDDIAHAVAVDSDGDIVIVGETYVLGEGADMLFVRLGPDAEPVWQQTHSSASGLGDRAFGVAINGDGQIAVTGEEYRLIGLHNVWTRLMDGDGAEIWTDVYDANAGNDVGRAVAFAADGGVLVAGHIYVPIGLADLWLRKYNIAGEIQWTRTSDHMNGNDRWHGIAVNTAGEIALVGEVYEVSGLAAIITAKYNPSGYQIWASYQDSAGGDNDIGRGAAVDHNSNLIAVGQEYTANDFARTWVRKFTTKGNELWTRTHDGDGGGNDIAWAVAVDAEGHIYAAGEEYVVGQFATVWLRKYAP